MRRHSDGNRHGTGHACVAMEPRDWLGGRGGGGGGTKRLCRTLFEWRARRW